MKLLQNDVSRKESYWSKRIQMMGVLCILSCLLLACGNSPKGEQESGKNPEDEGYYTFVDDVGERITLQQPPKVVAVLFSSYADVWKNAGGTVDITVGEAVERGFAKNTAILVDEGAGKTIDVETLIASKPDFVICSADIEAQADVAQLLNGSNIPAASFQVDTFDEYLNMLKICTDITGNSQAYMEHGQKVQEEIETIIEEVNQMQQTPRILFIRAGSSASATKAKTADENFVCGMLKDIGTSNIAEDVPILLDGLSIEEIMVQDPDFIFISTMGKESEVKAYMDEVLLQKEWQSLTAIQTGAYTYLPKDLFQYKPNARWAEAYSYLVDLLYDK